MLDLLTAPLRALVLLGVIQIIILLLNLPLIARQLWAVTSSKLAIALFTWLFIRVVSVLGKLVGRRLQRLGRADSTAVVRLIQRTVNLVAVFLAVVILLRSAGFDVTAVAAGLGVGGIAIAFAAQKTLENLFGGISIIFDKPIRVGDLCRIGNQEGRVEDIGLRSTRFRTYDRTVLTVPNGQLSVINLENLGMRDKMWFQHTIGVRSETTRDQMSRLLEGLRRLLAENPMVEPTTARVRLVRLSPPSMDLEVFACVLTTDKLQFLEVQEQLLLRILEVVEESGTATAFPSQVVYLNRDLARIQGRKAGTSESLDAASISSGSTS